MSTHAPVSPLWPSTPSFLSPLQQRATSASGSSCWENTRSRHSQRGSGTYGRVRAAPGSAGWYCRGAYALAARCAQARQRERHATIQGLCRARWDWRE
eukprot:scaffold9778_cov72-Phaeocystis_antarctica.AAC.6